MNTLVEFQDPYLDELLEDEYEHREPSLLRGLAVGVVAGLVASLAMNSFQSLITTIFEADKRPDPPNREHGAQGQKVQPEAHKRNTARESEPATVKAAEFLSKGVLDHKLRKSEKEYAGQAMHYIMGAVSGAIYGATVEYVPEARIGFGSLFGAAVWLLADEVTVPVLGLAKPPLEYPLSVHAKSLASHFVFGTVTEATRRIVGGI